MRFIQYSPAIKKYSFSSVKLMSSISNKLVDGLAFRRIIARSQWDEIIPVFFKNMSIKVICVGANDWKITIRNPDEFSRR